jgi:hypothetical protein
MTNSTSKATPRKQKMAKAFAAPMIPLWPRATWAPETLKNQAGKKTRKTKLTLSTEPGNENGKKSPRSSRSFKQAVLKNGFFGAETSTRSVLAWP